MTRILKIAGIVVAVLTTVTGVTASYLHAVKAEQDKTKDALDKERASHALAEQRAQFVRDKQTQIDELEADLHSVLTRINTPSPANQSCQTILDAIDADLLALAKREIRDRPPAKPDAHGN